MPWESTTADGISRGESITANHAADMTDTANHVATTAHNRVASGHNQILDGTTPMISVLTTIQGTDHSLETEMARYMVTIDLTKTNQDNKIKSTK